MLNNAFNYPKICVPSKSDLYPQMLNPRGTCTPKSKCEWECWFYSPVNTVEIMLSQSINLFTLFLGRLSPLNTVLVHILLPVTDNYPSRISGRGRMTVEMVSQSISMKVMWHSLDLNLPPPGFAVRCYQLCYEAQPLMFDSKHSSR